MDSSEARAYIKRHDDWVKMLNRKTVTDLRAFYAEGLAAKGKALLFGGPVSKDEYISAILDLEFPAISQARDTYYKSLEV